MTVDSDLFGKEGAWAPAVTDTAGFGYRVLHERQRGARIVLRAYAAGIQTQAL
jgi:hypothetical protein